MGGMTVEEQSGGMWRVIGPQGWGVGVDFPSEEAAREVAATIERCAVGETTGNALLQIHRGLYPERYPYEGNESHVYWADYHLDDRDEASYRSDHGPYEWNSGTIEHVAEDIERALRHHPGAHTLTSGWEA